MSKNKLVPINIIIYFKSCQGQKPILDNIIIYIYYQYLFAVTSVYVVFNDNPVWRYRYFIVFH